MKWKQNKKYSYTWVHNWVYENLGKPYFCENNNKHISKRFEWSNISGKYLLDKKDWKQLCVSCHRKLDMTDEAKMKIKKAMIGSCHAKVTPVKQLTKDGKFIAKFKSIKEACIKYKIHRSIILDALSGRRKTGYKSLWVRI